VPPLFDKETGFRGRSILTLPLLSALLLLLAQPPFRLIFLPFTALVPLVVALTTVGEGRGAGRRASWVGVIFGVVYWGVLLAWVPLVVAPRFSWAYPGYVVQVSLLSGLLALMAWSTHRLHKGLRIPLPLAFPLAWVAMEWLKAHFPLGLSFPWLGLGITLTSWPELLGMAEWTGEAGVAFWLASVNGLLAAGVVGLLPGRGGGASRTGAMRILGLAVVVAVVPALMGAVRTRGLPLVEGPRVAVVGTGVPAALRLREVEGSWAAVAQVESSLEGVEPGAVDLVVLPEATVSLPLDGPQGLPFRRALGRIAQEVGAPILVGGLGEAGEYGFLTNSAFLVEAGGALGPRYDKVRLVPGMEWGKYAPGVAGATVEVGGLTLAPLVCYEALFGGQVREQRRRGADLMVNLSSDVWFGGEGGVGRGFLRQHPAHLVMRAVETRMGVARAANGGISLLLGPRGNELVPPLSPGTGTIRASVPLFPGRTLFSRTGDLVGPLSLLTTLLLLLVPFIRSRSSSAPSA
jgi:apolipoprotein N-acyltransferase